ncbi:MAG: hypothetical protein AAGJ92_02760 [Pseudomonadota bacterium]
MAKPSTGTSAQVAVVPEAAHYAAASVGAKRAVAATLDVTVAATRDRLAAVKVSPA